MKALPGIVTLAIIMSLVTGCYYYDRDYARSPYGYSNRAVQPPPQPPAWDQPGQQPGEQPPVDPADFGDYGVETPLPPDEAALRAEGSLEEAGLTSGFDFKVRLIGVQAAAKPDIEEALRGEPGVGGVEPLQYANAELTLGVRFEGSVAELKNAIFKTCRGRASRFVIEMAGQGGDQEPLKVRVFAPADGSRLASSAVFVGVEVEGDGDYSVTVNGIPAEPLPAQGRFRARIECQQGSNAIIAQVRDRNGRTGTDRILISVAGEEQPVDKGQTVLVFGVVSDPLSIVTVDGRPVKVERDGTYRIEAPLQDGKNFVTVVITDSVGNKTVKKIGK